MVDPIDKVQCAKLAFFRALRGLEETGMVSSKEINQLIDHVKVDVNNLLAAFSLECC